MDLDSFKYTDRKLLSSSFQLWAWLFVNLDILVVALFRVHSVVNRKISTSGLFGLFRGL